MYNRNLFTAYYFANLFIGRCAQSADSTVSESTRNCKCKFLIEKE